MFRAVLLFVILAIAAPPQNGLCDERNGRAPVWEHKYVTVNGVKLHFVEQGSGQVVLFLHGFPEFWYAWKEQIPEFAKTHRAIALDMRGYNLSDKPAKLEAYALPALLTDIKEFLGAVSKGKKAILVAHDWGGALAWAYAALYPDTLERLVIINAPHPTVFSRELANNPDQQKASGYMNFFKSAGAEQALTADHCAMLSAAVFGSSTKPTAYTDEDRKAYLEAWNQPGAITGGLNYYRAANLGPPGTDSGNKQASSLPALPTITVPTLVIWGEKDTALLTGNLNGLDKCVKKLTVKRIPTGSHWVIHEEPELINTMIREFIK